MLTVRWRERNSVRNWEVGEENGTKELVQTWREEDIMREHKRRRQPEWNQGMRK